MVIFDKKARFNLQGLLIGMLLAFGLFFAIIGGTINSLDNNYDTAGYDSESIAKYDRLDNLSSDIEDQGNTINDLTLRSNPFDFLGDIFSRLISPFKTLYQSYKTLITVSGDVTSDFKLMPSFKAFFTSAIIILVVVGLVMTRFYMGRR